MSLEDNDDEIKGESNEHLQIPQKTLSEYSEELKKNLVKHNIDDFDYSEFVEKIIIGKGASAIVYSATFKGRKYALKSLDNYLHFDKKSFEKLMREIKILGDVDHPNVIKFFGTSRNHETGNFMIILQYANNGNLRDHLKKKQIEGKYEISCAEVFKIAKQIVSGLKYLHDKNIIHRDLHSKNILIIDDDKVLIADFGIAKCLNDSSTLSSKIAGMSPYIDCQCIQHIKKTPDKESDIYSLGVLFWELTSGVPPFNKVPMAVAIIEIAKGRREETIEKTPPNYAELYKRCWSFHSAERPTLEEILSVLEKLSKEIIDEIITNNVEHDYLYNGPNTSKDEYESITKHYSLIEKIINEFKVDVYDYNQFHFNEGESEQIETAYCKSLGKKTILNNLKVDSSVNDATVRQYIGEIKSMSEITKDHPHPYVNQFYGIAKDYINKRFFLIRQYADGGDLRKYLRENLDKLKMNDKLRIALEIVIGLMYLHKNKIVYKNFDHKNVLFHNRQVKISIFGIPEQANIANTITINSAGSTSDCEPAYIDPQYLKNHNHDRDEKSNIYSLGVLLWEIYSCRPPFHQYTGSEAVYQIFKGKRESPIDGTPREYVELYKRCWDETPEKRPEIHEIFETLKLMLKKSGDETVLKNILEIVNKPDAQQENKPNKITDNPPEIYLNDKLLKHVEHNEYLLKSEHFKLISEWVYEVSRTVLRKFLAKLKFKVSNPSYSFKLLFKESEDGFTPTDFHKKCDNKGPTLTVLKIKGENEILGGYNPYNWNSPTEQIEISTKKSFIFKFNLNNPENFVFSRAKRYKKAVIKLSSRHGPNFKDLRMTNGSQDGSRWRYSHKFYEKKIRDSEPDTFSVDDYEVFQVELKG